jgi:hypothetical protein
MAEDKVKLTIRLPAALHQTLKERAVEYNVSLNQILVDTLVAELEPKTRTESDDEKYNRILQRRLAKTDWMDRFIQGVELPTQEEARTWLDGVPLSDWIIEDRGPR